jgi:hypothetical protein
MKPVLFAAQCLCLVALYRSSVRKLYPLLLIYLAMATLAVLALQIQEDWLQSWYVLVVAPVALFRLLAALEVSHRQTEGFLGWPWLMPAVWFGAAVLTCACWNVSGRGSALHQFVELRRAMQIWQAAVLLLLESWWLFNAGWYREKDWIAAAFSVGALNHGVVSFAAVAWGWTESGWPQTAALSWGVDALVDALLGAIFLWPGAVQKCLVGMLGFLFGIRLRLFRTLAFWP